MSGPVEHIETLYFDWLCSKTGTESLDYQLLLNKLHSYDYVWIIPGDDNRAEDCYDLRLAFFREYSLDFIPEIIDDPRKSVLEVLVAFSSRASFASGMSPEEWFWIMMRNLNLIHFPDELYSELADEEIDQILHTFVWRLYDSRGHGGLFPLRRTMHDQTKVEIWYQFSEYLVNNHYI